ncbi:MAG: internal scaffolding protein [Microvirus sp.]|nr:MAG: internal scaffolding protein [Microvirus sp.]
MDLISGVIGFVPAAGCRVPTFKEVYVSVKKIAVRDPMTFDSHLYDDGLDCSVDPATGATLTSLTKQSFADDCDINNIMRKYERTGVLDHVGMTVPQYGEYMGSMSYQESLNAILYAQDQFSDLPAELRARFGNDPAQLLAFVEDPANLEEGVKLGLFSPPGSIAPQPPSEPPAAAPVPDTAPAERTPAKAGGN